MTQPQPLHAPIKTYTAYNYKQTKYFRHISSSIPAVCSQIFVPCSLFLTPYSLLSIASCSPQAPLPPQKPHSITQISALPYPAWRNIISFLPVRDVINLDNSVTLNSDYVDLFYAIEDPTLLRKLRFIARRQHLGRIHRVV